MASERMMQAIGAVERAIDKLERQVAALPVPALTGPAPTGPAPTGPMLAGPGLDDALSPASASQARAALKSLDELIAELKAKTDG